MNTHSHDCFESVFIIRCDNTLVITCTSCLKTASSYKLLNNAIIPGYVKYVVHLHDMAICLHACLHAMLFLKNCGPSKEDVCARVFCLFYFFIFLFFFWGGGGFRGCGMCVERISHVHTNNLHSPLPPTILCISTCVKSL